MAKFIGSTVQVKGFEREAKKTEVIKTTVKNPVKGMDKFSNSARMAAANINTKVKVFGGK